MSLAIKYHYVLTSCDYFIYLMTFSSHALLRSPYTDRTCTGIVRGGTAALSLQSEDIGFCVLRYAALVLAMVIHFVLSC
jgi:hypothetical protein